MLVVNDPWLFLDSARKLVHGNQYDAALAVLLDLLPRAPDFGEGWLLLAELQLQRHDVAAAHDAASRAARLIPQNPDAHYILGRAHKEQAKFAAAAACYLEAIRLEPSHANALTSLAIVEARAGRAALAMELYRRVLALDPNHASARINLQRLVDEMAPDQQAVSALARDVSRRRMAGIAHAVQGRPGDALAEFNAALELAPESAQLWLMAGTVAMELGMEPPRLLPYFETAERLDPKCSTAVETARAIRLVGGIVDETTRHGAPLRAPDDATEVRLERALFVPAIMSSIAEIRAVRARYERTLDSVLACDRVAGVDLDSLRSGSFFLAYHGLGNRDLHSKLAQLHAKLDPELFTAAASVIPRRTLAGRLRIGFLSRHLAEHSIGKTTRGLIEHLDRGRFETYAIRICPSVDDHMTRQICAAADREIALDKEVDKARAQIAALNLDVLFYQDIGLDPMAYRLAFSRLARVQCLSFGHPDTTGIPNMDYFVSSDLYELPGAQNHYSEKLYLLRKLPTLAYYYRPARSERTISRDRLGIPAHGTLYACPQALFKFHPDFDWIIREILTRDSHGVIVLIRGNFEHWTRSLQSRFADYMPEVAQRILFLPTLDHRVFLELLAMADVVLDTIHFNGMNSSLECFAVGTPVVTMPTEFQRGRHTQAMYESMGITDCIAYSPQAYADIAVRIGTDRELARRLREQILTRNDVLFENACVVSEFERFFTEVAAV
jgi:predicted O-linked N-acetylglucosamine transferase (SPINDLY family)